MSRQVFVNISDTIETWRQKSNTMSTYLGDLDQLQTTDNTDLVEAINEVKNQVSVAGIRSSFSLSSSGTGNHTTLSYNPVTGIFTFVSNAISYSDIPDLDADKITTGTFAASRIPSLDASYISSGILDSSVIPPIASGAPSTTDDLPEGVSNLYYTDTKARNAISSSSTEINYNSSTGALSFTGLQSSAAGEGIDISAGVISGEDATTSNKGIASFNSSYFSVSSGDVSIKESGIQASEIANATITYDKLNSSAISTSGEYSSSALNKILTSSAVFNAVSEIELTDGTFISLDLDTGFNFRVTLGDNRTLNNPTNAKAGQCGCIRVIQDGSGGRQLAFGNNYVFAGGNAPSLTADAGAQDLLFYQVINSSLIFVSIAGDVQ